MRVERLMSDYFRHARIVSRSLEWARKTAPVPVGAESRAVARRHPLSRPGAGGAQSRHLGGRVRSRRRQRQAEMSEEALSCIQQHVDRYRADDFFPQPRDRATLMRFLKPRDGAVRTAVGDARLRTARPDVPRVPGDLVAGGARLLSQVHGRRAHAADHPQSRAAVDGGTPTRHRFRSILADLPAPELLVLALLFHDVGKWRDDDHALESVRMAAEVLDRLQLPAEQRDIVLFLIRHHLKMSLVAFRRDTEDPEIVKQFAALVGTEERLKMLCLMTLVDVEAVSPETLTPWKEELLWRLYVDTYNHLTQRYGDELIERNQAEARRSAAAAPGRSVGRPRSRGFSKDCRSATCSCSRATPSTATCGWRATSSPTRSICRSSRTTASGRWPWSRSTSRSCSRTSAARWRRSAWTSCAATR